MSKLLKKGEHLDQVNSTHISQIKAGIDSLIATHTADDNAHHDYKAHLMIGTANAAYVPMSFEVEITPGSVKSSVNIANVGATNMDLRFILNMPTNRGGLKLYIKGWRIGLIDADAAAYIDRIRVYGLDFNSTDLLDDNAGNYIAPAQITDDFGGVPVDVSSYSVVVIRLGTVNDVGGEIDITQVEAHCYYDI